MMGFVGQVGIQAGDLFARGLAIQAALGSSTANRVWAIFLGIAFAVIAVSLLVASWTRWGQSKPLTKCVGIAILAHIWLLLYAYGTRVVSPGIGPGQSGGIAQADAIPAVVAWVPMDAEPSPSTLHDTDHPADPAEFNHERPPMPQWASPLPSSLRELDAAPPLTMPDKPQIAESRSEPEVEPQTSSPQERSLEELLALANLPIDPELRARAVAPTDTPMHKESEPSDSIARSETAAPSAPSPSVSDTPPRDLSQVPAAYRMRMSPHRQQYAAAHGGDSSTETAVEQALLWLARAQSADGSWSAAFHGAGAVNPSKVPQEGSYRARAGLHADTAMTGLALLSFLGAGHTHRDGPYAETVAKGLRSLMAQQLPSGDLSGRNQVGQDPSVRYARMYSHGMASLALAEAYAMTSDAELLRAVQGGAGYSLKAMNPRTGGWRYDFASDDPGDTSQFGWQAMGLHSAHNSRALLVHGSTRVALQRFLDSVQTGRAGGLAVYRHVALGTPPPISGATPAMTAESMAMRYLLGLPVSSQASAEARGMMMAQLPGQREVNFYYWYYAALALFQMRAAEVNSLPGMRSSSDVAWEHWNNAMKQQLCSAQRVDGSMAGSWDPNCVWGAYGGRVYTTALGCMCLEVYYRYMPIYQTLDDRSP